METTRFIGRARTLAAYGLLVAFVFGSLPASSSHSQAQTHTIGQARDLNPRNFQMPPFPVWTGLGQRDMDEILPRGATARMEGADRHGNKYLVTGITDLIAFAVDFGARSAQRNAGVPGVGKPGATAPLQLDSRAKDAMSKLAEAMNIVTYAKKVPADPRNPFPVGPLPNPQLIILERPAGFDLNREPISAIGGRWVRYCEPVTPCARPAEPIPEDVSDCAAEHAEVDRLIEKIDAINQNIKAAQALKEMLEFAESAGNAMDVATLLMAGFAVATCPVSPLTCAVLVGGYLGGYKAAKAALADLTLSQSIQAVQRQIDELRRVRSLYMQGLSDAYRELENCRTAAAAAEGRNTAAFQRYITVDLKAYYDCLKLRRCGWRWIPG